MPVAPSVYDDLPGDPSLVAPADDALGEDRAMAPPEKAVEDTPVPEAPGDSSLESDDTAEDVIEAATEAAEETSTPE